MRENGGTFTGTQAILDVNPFPKEELSVELKKYKNAEITWCQEEPRNMGAWKFVEELIEETLVEIKHKNSPK
jgi:2-oxoglutarate dehydrogenase E1 component